MNHYDRRIATASRRATAGGISAGLIYGVGLWADHHHIHTGREGTIRQAVFGPVAAVLRAVAAFAVPVAVLVLLVGGSALCVALVVFRKEACQSELPVEGSHLKGPDN
ncbi:hypothetical protein V2S66_18675 [Streptomyces sp. V4-01]|uniref:Uncharacterized protein n=1 Tax=Actinacidiphila polyblastidii TaxID=3110430 RepID=A0ABU7PFE9_9ACTN|nr:hypothetical protein [Streptomyces sp. V4-01]